RVAGAWTHQDPGGGFELSDLVRHRHGPPGAGETNERPTLAIDGQPASASARASSSRRISKARRTPVPPPPPPPPTPAPPSRSPQLNPASGRDREHENKPDPSVSGSCALRFAISMPGGRVN